MEIVIIPGFKGHPEEVIFQDLTIELEKLGHKVTKIAWPHIPEQMEKYSLSETLSHTRKILDKIDNNKLVLLGFSMGAIIATQLASEYKPQKLGLISSPYQVGSEDDLEGKYKEWQENGFRIVPSSHFGELKVPFSFIEDARKYNAVETIAQANCPVLFIAGELDDKVPPQVSKKLFDAAKEPKEWHQIPNMIHVYKTQPEIIKEVNKIIKEFIK